MLNLSISLPVTASNAILLRRLMLVLEAGLEDSANGTALPATRVTLNDHTVPTAAEAAAERTADPVAKAKKVRAARKAKKGPSAAASAAAEFGDELPENEIEADIVEADEPEAPSLDAMRAEMQKTGAVAGAEAVRALFKHYKVSRISDVPEKKRQAFVDALQAAQKLATAKPAKGK